MQSEVWTGEWGRLGSGGLHARMSRDSADGATRVLSWNGASRQMKAYQVTLVEP